MALSVPTYGPHFISLPRNCASLQVQHPALPSAERNRTTLWSGLLVFVYVSLVPLWVVPLYGTFWMAAASVSSQDEHGENGTGEKPRAYEKGGNSPGAFESSQQQASPWSTLRWKNLISPRFVGKASGCYRFPTSFYSLHIP